MTTSAEKTNRNSTTVQQKAQQQTFFRKAGEESFFGGKEQSTFFNAPVQAKLSVSTPDDPQEKEADAVADKVMRMAEPAAAPVANKEEEKLQKKEDEKKEQPEPVQAKLYSAPVDIQAKCESCEKEEKLQRKEEKDEEVQAKPQSPLIGIQRKEEREEVQAKSNLNISRSSNEELQASALADAGEEKEHKVSKKNIGLYRSEVIQQSGRGPPANSIPFEQSLSSSKGGGSALPGETKQFMESRFNADFSGVRIHTSSNAENMSRDINAQAFTHGNDIYFNSGKYSPGTSDGGALLAHELTHTIQQGASAQGNGQAQRQAIPEKDEKGIQAKINPTAAPVIRAQKKQQVQAKLDHFSKPGHGANANRRLKNEADRQAADAKRENGGEKQEGSRDEVRAAKSQRKQNLRPVGTPEINESRLQVPKITATKAKTKQKIEKPKKGGQNAKGPQGAKQLKGKGAPASPQAKSAAAMARANGIRAPDKPAALEPITLFAPKDAAGQALPLNEQQFTDYHAIGQQLQEVRQKGQELVEMGNFHEQQSFLIESQHHAARAVVAESDNNLSMIDQGITARRDAHQQGMTALQTAETKQQTVETALPNHTQSVDTAKTESADAATESSSLHSESNSNQPEDPEDRANSAEMGQQIGSVSRDTSSIDGVFGQSQNNIGTLAVQTQQAKAKNTATRASLQAIGQGIGQITAKSTELKTANQVATSQLNSRAAEPMEVRLQAIEMKRQGSRMIQNSVQAEKRLHDAGKNYQKNLAKVPPVFEPEQQQSSGGVGRKIQRRPGDYENRTDIFAGSFLDQRTWQSEQERARAQQEAEAANQAELQYIRNALPGDFSTYSAWTRIRVGLGAKINRFTNWISNLGVAGVLGGVGMLLVSMFNPMTYVHGIVGGFTQLVNGVVNLATDIWNLNFWGIVKSLADIATGIAIIAGTITGLALVVELAMTALLILSAIFTLGASAGFILPVMLFAGKVMVVAGKIAFWAGAAAAALNLIAGIKSLVDMGNAESAEDLQAQTNDFTTDMGGVATGLLNMVVGRAGMSGPARMANSANYAIGISNISAAQGAGVAARTVGGGILRGIAGIPAAIGQSIKQTASDIGGGIGRGINWIRNRLRRPVNEPPPRIPNEPISEEPRWVNPSEELPEGTRFEQQIKQEFRRKITRENEPIFDENGRQLGEIDFETSEALCEVGLSLDGKLPQLMREAELAVVRAKRLDVFYDVTRTAPGRLDAYRASLRLRYGNRVRFIPKVFIPN